MQTFLPLVKKRMNNVLLREIDILLCDISDNQFLIKQSPKSKLLTYGLIFLLLHAGTHISLLVQSDLAVSDYYLPTAIAVVLIHWLGPRYVLPMMYLNGVVTSYLWGNSLDHWPLWFLFAIPEVLYPFFSWFFFRKVFKGKFWLPDISNTLLFLFIGVFAPVVVEILLLQSMLVWTHVEAWETFWAYVKSNLLSEFITSFCLTLPCLHYLSHYVWTKGLIHDDNTTVEQFAPIDRNEGIELTIIFFLLTLSAFTIEFAKYWYVYGFFSLFVAIRYGFGPTLLTNFYILLIAYILPRIFLQFGKNTLTGFHDISNTLLAANFLFIFAVITSRILSDLRNVKSQLTEQNQQLLQTNQELDRFVYSVSHNLSAPAKSILGLVNITRITKDPNDFINNLNRIETSVVKLERFISEILQYSRNKRQDAHVEEINLRTLFDEILGNMDLSSARIQVQFDLDVEVVTQDRDRLKMIFNNLLANALHYQKTQEGNSPYIKIQSRKEGEDVLVTIEDNGEGIKAEHQANVFDMFYRANVRSTGAGLGLYIARQAAMKINATLTFTSFFGEGSAFALRFKSN